MGTHVRRIEFEYIKDMLNKKHLTGKTVSMLTDRGVATISRIKQAKGWSDYKKRMRLQHRANPRLTKEYTAQQPTEGFITRLLRFMM